MYRLIDRSTWKAHSANFALKLSEKGCGWRSEGGFGWYTQTDMPFRRPVRLLSQAHPRLFRQFLYSTLAIWPRITSHRLGSLQRPLGLFVGRCHRPTRKKSPCKELAVVGRFILRKGTRGHEPYSTWLVGAKNLDQRFCRIMERSISIPIAHKWLKSS